jgi:hypothetical protein
VTPRSIFDSLTGIPQKQAVPPILSCNTR